MADNVEIVVNALEAVVDYVAPTRARGGAHDGKPDGFTDEELLSPDAEELEALTREAVLDRLEKLPKTHRLRRLLLEPMQEGRPLTNVVIFDVVLKLKTFLLLVWYLRFEPHAVRAIVLQEVEIKDQHAQALAWAMERCPLLETVNLDNNRKLHDLGLAAVCVAASSCPVLKVFVAQNCDFADVGGYLGRCLVRGNRSLQRIDVSGNRVCANACVAHLGPALTENITLLDLDLHNNSIGDDGLAALAEALAVGNIVLEELKAGENGLTARSGRALGRVLASNTTLHTLWLQNNNLKDAGVADMSRGAAHNRALRDIRLNQNNISDAGAVAIAAALLGAEPPLPLPGHRASTRRSKKVDLEDLEGGAEPLENGENAAEAEDDDDEDGESDEAFYSSIRHLPAVPVPLQKLSLQDNLIDRRGMTALAESVALCPALRILNLGRNKLVDDCSAALGDMVARNASLTSLNLEGNALADATAIALSDGLRTNTTLLSLNLARNNIRNRGAEHLGQMLASAGNVTLKRLNLDGNPIENKGWVERAAKRGVTGPSEALLDISVDGVRIAKGTEGIFGVKLAVSETITRFSWFLLGLAVVTNWVDLATDMVVVKEFWDSAQAGAISYSWFVFSLSFGVIPSLYIVAFMSDPEELENQSWRARIVNGLMSITQTRVAYEALESYRTHYTTERFGSIRVVEVVGESGPQAFLQINFLLSALGRTQGDASEVANFIVLLSISLSLFVLGQTFSDLFDKDSIQKRTSGLAGFALFVRLLPCWVFHICQLSFRALTIAVLSAIFHPGVAAALVLVFILVRVAIMRVTRSTRRWQFAVLVTFLANSAWDRRAAVLLGIFASTVEAGGALTALWLAPADPIPEGETRLPWVSDTDFAAIDPLSVTVFMGSLFALYISIFALYIYPLKDYTAMADLVPQDKLNDIKAHRQFNVVMGDLKERGKDHLVE